ncbi:branched-chain amino acid transport system permease protein [Actinokineospora alba]|uniref:Branched-chain amino acid transport system permease protein n=1 Tax=Actinokineospora alba TaxID=504798 RepID=A0A1H0TV59_9PSEU|nr:branched-chain amino acid ABC transporter permease [Actinokineospora alba]TDP70735.1 branched-chain amino acid transport system permease protein [Actinokineospora alba]SDJ14867.1 branched-chain amino acid transport system permease protein [Actinokineospora alba]SDP57849.1 branched-chain amino acid transport system permease protein [Actinokineospora alba]
METFLQLVVNGVGKGAVFALLALGFVVIFKATEVVNFAHGSLVLVGGYLVVVTRDSLGWVGAAVVGIVSAGLLALLVERLLLSRSKLADANSLALLTIGLDVIITEEIVRRLGVTVPFLGEAWDAQPIQVGGLTLFRTHLVAIGVGAVLVTAFFLAFRYSNWGVAMRAQAENREAAALMGIRSSRVTATAWLVAGLLAGVAVLFIATQDFSGSGLSRGTHSIALAAFPAAILGGLDSTAGAVVGGLVVGLTEALSAQYISFDFSKSAVFLVMLVVLVVRPSGLFGTRESTRV